MSQKTITDILNITEEDEKKEVAQHAIEVLSNEAQGRILSLKSERSQAIKNEENLMKSVIHGSVTIDQIVTSRMTIEEIDNEIKILENLRKNVIK